MREHVELGSKAGVPRTHAGDPLHGESQGQSGTAGEELDYKTATNYSRSLHDFISMQKFAKNFGQHHCYPLVGRAADSPSFA